MRILKTFLLHIVCCLFFSSAFAQLQKGQIKPSEVPVPDFHYLPEYTFDEPVDAQKWEKDQQGMRVSFGSADELYLRSEVPGVSEMLASQETAWRGERVNFQVLVWSSDTLKQVRFKVNDLVSDKGQTIKADKFQLNLVRYVLSNAPYGATDVTCGMMVNDTAYLMPDRFEAFDRFDLPGRSVRPVWLSVDIPSDAAPGEYAGSIEVLSEKHKKDLQIKIKVQDQQLPAPADWEFRLDLWQNPWVVAWYYDLEPWSDEHKALLKKHLKLYADAGGTYITTYAVHSPWSDNSYMIEGAMIDLEKKQNGSWSFDYNIFDQYVELAMETGIDEAITIYTPVPWGHRFRYMDEKTGNYVWEVWSPESEEFKAFWNVFLDDLKDHLEKKGWFDITYLGINENPLNITKAAIKVIKDHSKDWRITYAGDWHAELDPLLDDYSPVISKEPSREEIKARAERGFTTTYYVCCTPPQPNNFVFSPPIEGRYISWHAAAYGYDGFLRWAYDAWPEDPMRDARHTLWPAGDCFLVYPGGNSSIRFEKLREGIVDYEKIRILKAQAAGSSDKKTKKMLKELENHLNTFIGDKDYSKRDYNVEKMTEAVHTGEKLIENLSDHLAR